MTDRVIPLVDLKANYLAIKEEVDAAIAEVIANSRFILGPAVACFETDFASFCKVEHAIGVNSGTSALHLALLAAGIGPGDEVITSPFTFVATAAAIVYTGARPVFVDIQPESFNIDPSAIESAITPRTKAVVPVHLYGQPAEMDPIMAVARRHGLKVIEDACQAHGATYRGQPVGSLGHMGCFSFYPGKNLGAFGEGGAVTTNEPAYAENIRMLRDWGARQKYCHELRGYNYRMEGLQGAVLGVKLKYLPRWNALRGIHAGRYTEKLRKQWQTPDLMPDRTHVFHVYALRTIKRDALHRELNARGVQAGIHYPHPVHLLRAYEFLGYSQGEFPHAERAAREVLSLPIYPELTETDIDLVCARLDAARAVCL